jgi:hypothetical protein
LDAHLDQVFEAGEHIDLEEIYEDEPLYHSSQIGGALRAAITNGDLIRRTQDDGEDVPADNAFDDAVWMWAPTKQQKEALLGTSGSPSAINKYVTDTDPRLKISSLVQATSNSTLALTATSPADIVFTGSTVGQVVQMYDPTGTNLHLFWIHNRSTVPILLTDQTSSPVTEILPYQKAIVTPAGGTWAYAIEPELIQSTITTHDGNPTVIQTIAVPNNSVFVMDTKVTAVRTSGTAGSAGDSAAYFRVARFKNIGGIVTRYKPQTSYTSDEDQPSWDCQIQVNGTNINVVVTGANGNNVLWTAKSESQVLTF